MSARRRFVLTLPRTKLVLGPRTLLMGVLNVTPDSFSDGGRFFDPDKAAAHALAMQRAGADLIDIGGESTRPGSAGVSAAVELRRVLPVLRRLRGRLRVPISIDTAKADVAEAAIRAGAQMVNDTSGLRADPRLAEVARRYRVPLVLMHIRGTPRTMQKIPFARNILRDVEQGLRRSVRQALQAGVRRSQLLIDPGLGFGKTAEQNYEIIQYLNRLARLRLPLLLGPSRKTFIGKVLGNAPASDRLMGTAAAVTASILAGAHIVRVHDVAEMAEVARVADAFLAASHTR
ncbi:MAG: dihydropteroate synthase [Acidobacteria bacterium RIFCSPHIGHO2_02_FULL_67_57]|nr:MAG: dihydropteroate synthase [Acidobacteria bacterium RIFCSPHIGHO2_02_FULL_67_57]OFV84027.1 MAG: dihydropteroate synthase [Acidobacteria bacterium RIFCSPHIGHO2_01_FULL_67_28]